MSSIAPPATALTSYTSTGDAGYNVATSQTIAGASGIYASPSAGSQDIDKLSTDFEAVFLSQMMGAMFSGDEITAYFGGGTAGEIYKSFLMDQYGKAMAQAGGIGIATQVKKELLKLQEVS